MKITASGRGRVDGQVLQMRRKTLRIVRRLNKEQPGHGDSVLSMAAKIVQILGPELIMLKNEEWKSVAS